MELLIYDVIVFSKNVPSFGMPDNDIVTAQLF